MQHGLIFRRGIGRTHVARLVDGQVTDLTTEPDQTSGALGSIYVGRVVRVVPGMQAAFVAVGLGRTAFLYVDDVLPPSLPAHGDTKNLRAAPKAGIEGLLKPGATVVVQVRKEAMGDKGARVTTHVTLTGRHVVLMPLARHVAISQRIEDKARRAHLMALLEPLSGTVGGMVVRTAARDTPDDQLVAEAHALAARWQTILADAKRSSRPRELWGAQAPAAWAVREWYQCTMQGVRTDEPAALGDLTEAVEAACPGHGAQVRPWQHAAAGTRGLTEGDVWRHHGIERTRTLALAREVPLPGGGSLVIEACEALTVIDVNSGSSTGKRSLEDTMVAVNVRAAVAIARELRLRNVGGMVVIDFIDLTTTKGRDAVMTALEGALAQDPAKHQILPMNRLGLVALTRKRARPTLQQVATGACPTCQGGGRVRAAAEVAEAVLSALYQAMAQTPVSAWLINTSAEVAQCLQEDVADGLGRLERAMGTTCVVVAQQGYPPSSAQLLNLDVPGDVVFVDLRLG